jgi:hypothetical protein
MIPQDSGEEGVGNEGYRVVAAANGGSGRGGLESRKPSTNLHFVLLRKKGERPPQGHGSVKKRLQYVLARVETSECTVKKIKG